MQELKFENARGIRYVKITVTGFDPGCWASISEVKVYAVVAGVADPGTARRIGVSDAGYRRTLMKIALICACGVTGRDERHVRAADATTEPAKPNIIFVLADDLGDRRRELLWRGQAPDAAHRCVGGVGHAFPDLLRGAAVRAVAMPVDDGPICVSHWRTDQ